MVLSEKSASSSYIKDKLKYGHRRVFGSSRLEKAKLNILDNTDKVLKIIDVQFNPSEYSISRSVTLEQSGELGRDTDGKSQAVRGGTTSLSVSLYFDTISKTKRSSMDKLYSALKSAFGGPEKIDGVKSPAKAAANVMDLTTYEADSHSPPQVQFVWGPMSFTGKISSMSTTYTMFTAKGDPVKAKVDLTIEGEETAKILRSTASPFQSPDRTKSRVLVQGDQLWMMAHQEYDDAEKWKIIAKSNNILNPRKVSVAASIKVPSIK